MSQSRRLGRRSWFLILFSCAYMGIGYGSYIQPVPLGRDPIFLHEMIPGWARAAIWIVGALMGFVGAFFRRHSMLEVWGFVGIILPMGIQSVSFGLGILSASYDVKDRHVLLITGATGFFVYTLILAAIMIVASWPEPQAPILEVERDHGSNSDHLPN